MLVAGGFRDTNLATAEIWDPATGLFTATANNLSAARGYATSTVLVGGKVLIAGGGDYNDGGAASAAAEIFDPATGMFTATTSPMNAARHGATATLLNSGKVLVAGGIASNSQARLATAELYDPATNTFSYTGSMHAARDVASAVKLPNGNVLICGGGDGTGVSLDSSEIYIATGTGAGTFTVGATMKAKRDDATATLLPGGLVLIVGGINNDVPIGSAELYDYNANTFTLSKSSITPRHFHTANLLASGQVLIAGGVDGATNIGTLKDAQLYDPPTDMFLTTGAMVTARYYHTATLLQDGRVLVAGGYNDAGVVETAEIYGEAGDQIFANGFDVP
ncbi:MAG TPA: kelch repeat-containing protein [Rudaea sp.]